MQTDKMNILIIEDEQDILDLLSYYLTQEGYQVTGIANGEQALQVLPRIKPHLIILDLMLPGLGGLDICRLLKTTPETAAIPVIMVTAKCEDEDVVTGLKMGADDYIAKPFSMKVLLARIETALRRNYKPDQLDEVPLAPDTVINLLKQVEGGLLTKIFEFH